MRWSCWVRCGGESALGLMQRPSIRRLSMGALPLFDLDNVRVSYTPLPTVVQPPTRFVLD